jgi:outer membrane protein assembly factor BamE (lipoprotein component of BamABCDE complex)
VYFKLKLAVALAAILLAPQVMAAASTAAPTVTNSLTHGQVQLTLKVGQTRQLEVVETFGSPNITTVDGSGQEVWIYHRHATVEQTESKGFSIGLLAGAVGGAVGGGVGAGYGKSKTGFEQSTRQMTLIIKFDAGKVVSDFKSRSSSF